MLQLIWACIESALSTLGLEVAAAIVASLVRQDGMTVASLIADVMLLTVLIIAVEKGLRIATKNKRIKWFLLSEGIIGFGSLLIAWIASGADFNTQIQNLVKSAGAYFVFPWVVVFVLSPLALVWLELKELLTDLGGSTISRKTQIFVFASFTAAWAFASFSAAWNDEWSWLTRLLVAMLLAVVPTLLVLVAIAWLRRRQLRKSHWIGRLDDRERSTASPDLQRFLEIQKHIEVQKQAELKQHNLFVRNACTCIFCEARRAAEKAAANQ